MGFEDSLGWSWVVVEEGAEASAEAVEAMLCVGTLVGVEEDSVVVVEAEGAVEESSGASVVDVCAAVASVVDAIDDGASVVDSAGA